MSIYLFILLQSLLLTIVASPLRLLSLRGLSPNSLVVWLKPFFRWVMWMIFFSCPFLSVQLSPSQRILFWPPPSTSVLFPALLSFMRLALPDSSSMFIIYLFIFLPPHSMLNSSRTDTLFYWHFYIPSTWIIVEQQIVVKQLYLAYLQISFCLLPWQVGAILAGNRVLEMQSFPCSGL